MAYKKENGQWKEIAKKSQAVTDADKIRELTQLKNEQAEYIRELETRLQQFEGKKK